MTSGGMARMRPERRARLLRVAASEFAAAGYEQASLNRIIRECGLSKSSFYHFVSSKRELFGLVVRELGGELVEAIRVPTPEAFAADFWAQLSELSQRLAEVSRTDPAYVDLGRMFYFGAPPPLEDAAVDDALDALRRWLQDVLEIGRSTGAVRDDLPAPLQAALVFAVLRALDEWTLADPQNLAHDAEGSAALLTAQLSVLRRMLASEPPAA